MWARHAGGGGNAVGRRPPPSQRGGHVSHPFRAAGVPTHRIGRDRPRPSGASTRTDDDLAGMGVPRPGRAPERDPRRTRGRRHGLPDRCARRCGCGPLRPLRPVGAGALRGPSAGAHRPRGRQPRCRQPRVRSHPGHRRGRRDRLGPRGAGPLLGAPAWPRHAGMPPGVTTGWRPAGDRHRRSRRSDRPGGRHGPPDAHPGSVAAALESRCPWASACTAPGRPASRWSAPAGRPTRRRQTAPCCAAT